MGWVFSSLVTLKLNLETNEFKNQNGEKQIEREREREYSKRRLTFSSRPGLHLLLWSRRELARLLSLGEDVDVDPLLAAGRVDVVVPRL